MDDLKHAIFFNFNDCCSGNAIEKSGICVWYEVSSSKT